MNERKTTRKNNTNGIVNWPSSDEYFTIQDLKLTNEHILTAPPKRSDITLRVKLSKAVTEHPMTVAVIGYKHCAKGRPQLVHAMRPVKQSVLDKAKSAGIMLVEDSKIVEIMKIDSTPANTPVTNIVKKTEVVTESKLI